MRGLVIDIGNTSTALGRYRSSRLSHVVHVRGGIKRRDDVNAALDRLAADNMHPEFVVLASVVPDVNASWSRLIKRRFGLAPLLVTPGLELGLEVDYPRPGTIGADRLANAAAVAHFTGGPAIVADFGTALTFDVVDARPAYVGGVIVPGLNFMTDYLADRTALLPHIKLTGRCGPVGRSTREAMRLGAHVGYQGMVREIVNHLTNELALGSDVALYATGGFCRRVVSGLKGLDFVVDQNLTLKGLGIIGRLNG